MRQLSDILKGTEEQSKFFLSNNFMKKQPDTKPRELEQRDFMIMTDIKVIQESLKTSRLFKYGTLVRVGDSAGQHTDAVFRRKEND